MQDSVVRRDVPKRGQLECDSIVIARIVGVVADLALVRRISSKNEAMFAAINRCGLR